MSFWRLDSATRAGALLLALLAPAALASVAWCTDAAGVAPGAGSGGTAAQAPGADGWAVMAGAGSGRAPVATFDPARFIGPPVPMAMLFSPDNLPFQAGMRIDLDPHSDVPGSAVNPAAAVPTAGGAGHIRLLSDVTDRLVVIRMPDGSLMVDLTDIYVSEFTARRTARGLELSHDFAPTGGALEDK